MSNPYLIKTFVAATAIPTNRVVKLAAGDNEVALAIDVADPLIGLSNEPKAVATGGRIDVTFSGIVNAEAGAAINKGAWLSVDLEGRVVTATATDERIGKAIDSAIAVGDIIDIEILKA